MDCGKIKQIYDFEVYNRKTLDQTYQYIERYVVPFRGEFFKPMTQEQEVRWRRREIYDSTAIDANEMLAATLQGWLTSNSTMWVEFGFRENELNRDKDSMLWLQNGQRIFYEALNDSNFDLESSEFYLDLTSYGTSVIVEETESELEWKGLDFQSAPIRDCYFQMDRRGQILRFFRRYQWTPLQIIDKFGDKVPNDIKELAKQADQQAHRQEVIFCIYEEPANKDANVSTVLAKGSRPFQGKYIWHKTAMQLGETYGYYEMPAFITRWRKTSGSQWGYSPAFVCLSDILTLNEMTEQTLESLGKVLDPSTLVTARNLVGDLDLGKGGMTVVRDIDGIRTHESRARFDVGELRIDRLQSSINRAYRVDQLQLKDSPQMTATEVNVRYQMIQRLIGPTMGRLQRDFLDKLVSRTWNILYRSGQLGDPPELVEKLKGELDVQYVGPLARAQRQEIVDSTYNYMSATAELSQVWPELKDIPDIDKIGRDTAKRSGLPAEYIKSEIEVKRDRKERAQMEAEANQAAIAKEQGEAMKAQGEGAEAITRAMEQQ